MRRHNGNNRRRRSIVENDNPDRWLISYADFITLLFAFFVVMYAISSINEGKYRVLSDTLVTAFKTEPRPGAADASLQQPHEKAGQRESSTPLRIEPVPDENPERRMNRIADQVRQNLQPLIDQDMIAVTHNNLWVEVEINTALLYSSGSAALEPEAYMPLRKLAGVLKDLSNHIDVEGYTDNLPISTTVYPSNWQLSAARAASVVQLFIQNGISPERMTVIGYGEFRPKAANDTPEGRRQNRRVRVVILADKYARHMMEIERLTPPVNR